MKVPLNVQDPAIKKFIDAVHQNIIEKVEVSTNDGPVDFKAENRIFELFCANKIISPKNAAEQLNRDYRYNLTADDVIKKFDFQGIKTQEERVTFFTLLNEKVAAFIKLLAFKNKNDIESFDKAHINLMRMFDKIPRNRKVRTPEFEKFSGRIFCLTLYIKYPELNKHNDLENLENFGNKRAHSVYQVMFKQLKTILEIKDDETRQENELLRNTLQMQETDIKNLNENFEAQLQERMAEFFSALNSDKYGNILDAVISTYGGIQKLRKQKMEVPLELSDFFPLINNLKKFIIDNEITPIAKVGSVQMMSREDIENISGDYSGSPFTTADEVKKIKVISPGWYYKNKNIQISRPRLKEEIDDINE